jgi:Family of unknown function (DUF6159)
VRRLRIGWDLAKRSLRVVRADGALAALALLGAITAGFLALALGIPAIVLQEEGDTVLAIVLGAIGVYLATAAVVFFGVALASAAAEALAGRDARVGPSIAVATSRIPQVLGWALVLTTVNLIISALRDRGGLGAIASGIAGAAWSLATFFAVPLIALEGLGPWAALKRSSTLFKQHWGEQIVGRAGVGAMFFLVGVLPGAALIFLGVVLADAAGIVVGVVGVLIVATALLLGQAAGSVLAVALYRYATGSGETGPFAAEELESAVMRKGKAAATATP